MIRALLRKKEVTVGVHQKKTKRRAAKTGLTNAQVGSWQEFGTRRTPRRSFLRSTYDENEKAYIRYFSRSYARALKAGKKVDAPLRIIGLKIASDVRRKIDAGVPPPNAPSTIAKKGSSKPLIDTGALKRSIGHEVKT
jgi:hypothetical protein